MRRGGASRSALPKTLLLGSHLDTVRDAGRFDGPLGVLLPIVALADLKVRGVKLPFAVEVLGFSEEEGVRFASAYLGSKGYCGKLTAKGGSVSTLPDGFQGGNTTSELLIDKAGKHLYAANRNHDSIATFAIAADAVDNFTAGPPGFDHVTNDFRRVLKVNIYRDDCIAPGIIQPC